MKTPPASFGHFSENAREFVITDPLAPPRAQVNFLWNDTLISGINQFGGGDGVFNNQSLMYNHPKGRVRMIRDGRRYFYVRDNATGQYWNTGLFPTNRPGAKLTTYVGLGYSKFTLEYEGVRIDSRVFLAPDEPVEIWEFTVTDTTGKARDLTLSPYVEWWLGGYSTFSSAYSYLRSSWDGKLNVVSSYNTSDERPHDRYNAFVASDVSATQWCGGRREFFGPFGTPAEPRSIVEGKMSCREAWCEELAGAMALPVKLVANGAKQVTVILGSFDTEEEKARLINKVLPADYRAKAWEALLEEKEAMLKQVWIETPDESVNRLVNIWAKQQIQLCVEFGRDGARGFRDTLQDAWGILPFNSPLARSKIIETLRHQHQDGHGIRGWLPIQPHHYSDGPAWIAPAVAAYLQETGDRAFLDEKVPFLDGGEDTVLGHTLRGIRHLSDDLGVHGLVLAHQGDWNDSLNWMGKAGKGESVWTSMALYHSCNVVAEMARDYLKDHKLEKEMLERATKILGPIEEHGWDGDWYLAGWSDFGNPVGSKKNKEGQVYLNTQTWAALTGIAKGDRLKKCWKAVDEMLDNPHGSLTLWPHYTARDENVGRVTMLLPGMYENGTPYCHGTAFKIVAYIVGGRPDQALVSWHKVRPDNPQHPSSVSGCEPYAFTNQYLGPGNGRSGESISGWITGCAGWMFRAVLEYFCGIKPGYHGLQIEPCLPSSWPEIKVNRRLRGKEFLIHVRRVGSGYEITVNGQPYKGGEIPY